MPKPIEWTDIYDIAIYLEETYPDQDILSVRFTDLWQWVCQMPHFQGRPEESSEKILEAIQQAWLKERM